MLSLLTILSLFVALAHCERTREECESAVDAAVAAKMKEKVGDHYWSQAVYHACVAGDWLRLIYNEDKQRYNEWVKQAQKELAFEEVMEHKAIWSCMRTFAGKEFSDENIKFLDATAPLTGAVSSPQVLFEESCKVYANFIKEGGPERVNLPSHAFNRLKKSLGDKCVQWEASKTVPESNFVVPILGTKFWVQPRKEIVSLIQSDTFPRFLSLKLTDCYGDTSGSRKKVEDAGRKDLEVEKVSKSVGVELSPEEVEAGKKEQKNLIAEVNSFAPILVQFCSMEQAAYPKRSKSKKEKARTDVIASWKKLCVDTRFVVPPLMSKAQLKQEEQQKKERIKAVKTVERAKLKASKAQEKSAKAENKAKKSW